MAVAAYTDVGARRPTNEDACCVEVARTPLGDVTLAVVCDGVGGYSRGEVASATVIHSFSNWFEHDFPLLIGGMAERGTLDFTVIKAIWEVMLLEANRTIRAFGTSEKVRLGTTFTGVLACAGQYLVGHVGDCRALLVHPTGLKQITEDQTLAAKMAGEGASSSVDLNVQSHVILQAVGTQRTLQPVFYSGAYEAADIFVLCCDGVWKKPGNEGIAHAFRRASRSEASLEQSCRDIISACRDMGENDNMTVVAFFDDRPNESDEKVATTDENQDYANQATEVFDGAIGNDSPTLVFEKDDA